jgi:uncharacterized membrane protein YeaQ/YmgE (transglycosylase-associated protein family)
MLEIMQGRLAKTLGLTLLCGVLGLLVVFSWSGRHYSGSFDFGLHYALIHHIHGHLAWPKEVLPNLAEMSSYPAITHTLGAMAGYITGSPITGMTTVSFLSVFGSYVVILRLARFDKCAPTLLALAIFIIIVAALHRRNIFVGGEINGNFFYAQVVSFFIVLSAIQATFFGRFGPVSVAVGSIVITFGLGWVFPMAMVQFACATLAYFGLGTLRGLMADRRAALLYGGLLVALAAALPAAVVLHPTFGLITRIAANEGAIGIGGLSVQAVPAILLLCGVPIVTLAALYLFGKLKVERPLVLVTTALGIFGAALAQVLARKLGMGSNYGVAKHLFPVATMTAVVVAVLIANAVAPWLEKRLPAFPALGGSAVALAAFATFAILFSRGGNRLAPMLQTQEFIARHLPAVGHGRTISRVNSLLPFENFALTLGDLRYARMAGAVRFYNPRREGAAGFLAAAPVAYVLVGPKTSPRLSEDCTIVRSVGAPAEIVAARCVGRDRIYPLGEWVTLAQLPDREFLTFGWNFIEPWGVWSNGLSATLTLPLETIPSNDLVFEVDANAYLPKHIAQQRIEIEAGGQPVGTWIFSSADRQSARSVLIPASAVASGRVEITFRLPDAAAPPGEARRLALGLKAFRAVSPTGRAKPICENC